MQPEPHGILVAVSPPSRAKLRALLNGCDADYFDSYAEAISALSGHPYAAVLVGLHFGESRMFEFVRDAKRLQPGARVVCVQGTAGHLNEAALAAARIALEPLGAEGVIDLSRLSEGDCRTLAGLLRLPAAAERAH